MAATESDDSLEPLAEAVVAGAELVHVQLLFRDPKTKRNHTVTVQRYEGETFVDMLETIKSILEEVNDGEH